MIFDRFLVRAIQMLGLLAIATGATAQNTTPFSAAQYGTDQGWVQTTMGPTVGTNEQRWYAVELRPGRSYCMETALADFNDMTSDTVMYMYPDTALSIANRISMNDDYSIAGFTRGCFINATENLDGALMGIRRAGSDPPNVAAAFPTIRGIRFRLTDTTVTAPWWFVNSGSGYNAFVEVANNHVGSVNISVKALSAAGAVLGIANRTLAGKGNIALSVGSNFGVAITVGSGSIELAHDGPVGAINMNVTSLSAVEGLSFDSPGSRRTNW